MRTVVEPFLGDQERDPSVLGEHCTQLNAALACVLAGVNIMQYSAQCEGFYSKDN